MPKEVVLAGLGASHGIAIGIPYFLNQFEGKIPEIRLQQSQLNQEIERYRHALVESRHDIERLKEELQREGVKDGVSVLEAHLQIIEDPLLNEQIEREIRRAKKNAEFVFQSTIQAFREKFEALDDPFFQSRFEDVRDISKRILAYLSDMKRITLHDLPKDSIVFTEHLSPSEAAEANRKNVKAFVTRSGGAMSHTAIVTKAKGIPYVANVNFSEFNSIEKIEMAIVDGFAGCVILNPSEETLQRYRQQKMTIQARDESLKAIHGERATTQDGLTVRLTANVEIEDDFQLVEQYGAEGVGLFRSEYIVLARGSFPSEDEQFEIYKNLCLQNKNHPVVIRAFDIGMDKVACNIKGNPELNPALGLRAIRFLLHERALFKSQMRAILRASPFGQVRILFPMISCMSELLDAKAMVEEAKAELQKEGVEVSQGIKIGCMIEVPSAAMIADLLAKECDFLSIGTNDLTQYALAVDRTNQSTSALYTATHPAVLRLIKIVVAAGREANIPVSVCGEIASDPRFVPLLLGLGIKELSVSCRLLPRVKEAIRSTHNSEATDLVQKMLQMSSAHEIQGALLTEYERKTAG